MMIVKILFLVLLIWLGMSIMGFSLGWNERFKKRPWFILLLFLQILGVGILVEGIIKFILQ